jgi:cupin 2 domain-containing protein
MSTAGNIFAHIPQQLDTELFETLLRKDQVHIERIVSKGHITAEGEWYDQAWDEWVILLQGQAVLRYQTDGTVLTLMAGDYVFIPAHTLHRVEWTASDTDCIWLAVHLGDLQA